MYCVQIHYEYSNSVDDIYLYSKVENASFDFKNRVKAMKSMCREIIDIKEPHQNEDGEYEASASFLNNDDSKITINMSNLYVN